MQKLAALINSCFQLLCFRELSHLEAGIALSEGDWLEACRIWEDILTEHPKDIYASNLSFFGHLHTGRKRGLRDTPARIIKEYSVEDRYFAYVDLNHRS